MKDLSAKCFKRDFFEIMVIKEVFSLMKILEKLTLLINLARVDLCESQHASLILKALITIFAEATH